MENKSRPLNNNLKASSTFCAAPWGHLHFVNDGNVYPCCLFVNDKQESLGNINQQTVDEIYNGEPIKAMRKNMLQNKPLPKGCHDCIEREKNGLGTLRQRYNEFWFDKITESVFDDGKLENYTIKSLDVRLSNFCNFACAMCSPTFSTKWKNYKEITGKDIEQKLISVSQDSYLIKNLEKYTDNLEFIHFAGGEPILMPEHWNILDKIKNKTKLMYTTNASSLYYKEKYVFDEWQRFEEVEITLSIDGTDKCFEYIRHASNWQDVSKNIIKYRDSGLKYKIHPTVSILNVLELPVLHKWLIDNAIIKDNDETWQMFDLNPVFDPHYYNIQILPKQLKSLIEEKIMKYAENCNNQTGWINLIKFMNERDLDGYEEFKKITQRYDLINRKNFKNIFPELII